MSALPDLEDMRIRPLHACLGAEVTGIDLTRPTEGYVRQALYDALVDNIVLVIRGQSLTPDQLIVAAGHFGELLPDRDKREHVEGSDYVALLSSRKRDYGAYRRRSVTEGPWHTDHTNTAYPPKFTCLYPVALPECGGGTEIVNMSAAYEALSAGRRAQIDRMRTVNTRATGLGSVAGGPLNVGDAPTPVLHPLVRTHPERWTKAIWFHTGRTDCIEGMNAPDSQAFLKALLEEAIHPEFTYTHEWRMGDLLIVDNRSALYRACRDFDPSQHRALLRTMIKGDRPV